MKGKGRGKGRGGGGGEERVVAINTGVDNCGARPTVPARRSPIIMGIRLVMRKSGGGGENLGSFLSFQFPAKGSKAHVFFIYLFIFFKKCVRPSQLTYATLAGG